MPRLYDWDQRLYAYFDERREMPFAWGPNDCASFAAGAVEAMTGERPALPVYADERDALRLVRDRSLRERAGDALGAEIAPAFARRGDVVLWLQDDDRETLGVCDGAWIAGPGVDGLQLMPIAMAVAAWRA